MTIASGSDAPLRRTPMTLPDGTPARGPLRHALAIVGTSARLGILNALAYRGDVAISVINVIIGLASQIFGLTVIFGHTSSLNGWSVDAMLVLIGVWTFIQGILSVVISPSMQQLMEGIRLGTFDFTLTKPADAQLLAGSKVFAPAAVVEVLTGVGVIVFGCVRLGETVSVLGVVAFALTLLCGLVMFAAVLMLLSTLSFWFVKLDNVLVIFNAVFGQAGKWPVTIFPTWLRIGLTFILPIGFAVTVPAQALSGAVSWPTVGLSVLVAAVFAALSRLLWRTALRRYTGASS